MLDALAELNQHRFEQMHDPEIQTRIAQYEMAFRMQSSVPSLVDFEDESAATLESYGPDVRKPGTFASSALLARRMVERGVRVVQILHRGWDQHGNIAGDLPANAAMSIKLRCLAAGPKESRDVGIDVGGLGGRVWENGLLPREVNSRELWP